MTQEDLEQQNAEKVDSAVLAQRRARIHFTKRIMELIEEYPDEGSIFFCNLLDLQRAVMREMKGGMGVVYPNLAPAARKSQASNDLFFGQDRELFKRIGAEAAAIGRGEEL